MEEISILRMVPHKVYSSRAASLPKNIGFHKYLYPILRFITLFERDLQLCNEVRFSVRIVRFPNIRTDGSCGALKLINDRPMPVDRFR